MGKFKSTNNLFPLLRYFSLSASVLFLIVIIAMTLFFRNQSVNAMIEYGEQSNIVLTQALSNTIWPHFKPYAAEAAQLSNDELRNDERINNLNKLVLTHIRNTPVLKIKIFDLNGKTLFSTDYDQLGNQKSADYPGSLSAKSGKVISKLSHRDTFSSVNGVVEDREVVSSYLPIRDVEEQGEGITGVFEVYYDVTNEFDKIKSQQKFSFVYISALMLGLYLVLYLIVRRADRIILFQSIDLKNTMKKFEQKSNELKEIERLNS